MSLLLVLFLFSVLISCSIECPHSEIIDSESETLFSLYYTKTAFIWLFAWLFRLCMVSQENGWGMYLVSDPQSIDGLLTKWKNPVLPCSRTKRPGQSHSLPLRPILEVHRVRHLLPLCNSLLLYETIYRWDVGLFDVQRVLESLQRLLQRWILQKLV